MEIGDLSMKSDFKAMTMRELKKYVLQHRNDQAAFQELMDRIDAQPQQQVYGDVDVEQFSALLEQYQRLQQD
jgi:ribosomal protein S4